MPNTRIPVGSEKQAGEALNRIGKFYAKTRRAHVDGKWTGFTYFINFDGKEIGYYQEDLKQLILFRTPR